MSIPYETATAGDRAINEMQKMSKASGKGEDRASFFKLVRALEDVIPNGHQVAELIATMINQKIAHSEGKHHAKFHKRVPESE